MNDIYINTKESSYFRIVKLWQSGDFELILSLFGSNKNKCFLKISPNVSGFHMELMDIKPEFTPISGNFVEIFRKYIPSSIILKCVRIKKDIYIILKSNSSIYIICLNSNLEYELLSYDQITNEFLSLLRWGKKSTYTKRKIVEIDPNIKEVLLNDKDTDHHDSKYEIIDLLSLKKEGLKEGLSLEEKKQDTEPRSLTLKTLLQRLRRKRKTLIKSLEKLKSKTITESQLKELKEKAFYMKNNFFYLQQQDPSLTGQEIEKIFNEYKKKERNFSIGSSHIKEVQNSIDRLDSVINDIVLDNKIDVESVEKEFGLSKIQMVRNKDGDKIQKSSFYRKFKLEKYIYVGKDSKTNDELTKSLKSNDYWFHTVGGSGSHVAIKNDRKELSSSLIRQACILALFFSESRSLDGSVYFCQKLDLKKTTTPGLWKVLRSKTIDISYKQEEIDEILSKEEK